jgi:hypothetical protein
LPWCLSKSLVHHNLDATEDSIGALLGQGQIKIKSQSPSSLLSLQLCCVRGVVLAGWLVSLLGMNVVLALALL